MSGSLPAHLLVACPVIGPPDPTVLTSWDHRPHLVVINGHHGQWSDVVTRHGILPRMSRDPADRTPTNRGVAASWNAAFVHAAARRIPYVALISQHLVLAGGTGRLASLVTDHADWRGLLTDFAWRCIVLSVDLWTRVGPFDEQFWPGYYEDSDYVRRLELAGLHTPTNPIPKVGRDLLDADRDDVAVTLRSGLIPPDSYGLNAALYAAKWGGLPGDETVAVPRSGPGAGGQ